MFKFDASQQTHASLWSILWGQASKCSGNYVADKNFNMAWQHSRWPEQLPHQGRLRLRNCRAKTITLSGQSCDWWWHNGIFSHHCADGLDWSICALDPGTEKICAVFLIINCHPLSRPQEVLHVQSCTDGLHSWRIAGFGKPPRVPRFRRLFLRLS